MVLVAHEVAIFLIIEIVLYFFEANSYEIRFEGFYILRIEYKLNKGYFFGENKKFISLEIYSFQIIHVLLV